jgi:hypothetical protein
MAAATPQPHDKKKRAEWWSKWGLFGWANARRGAHWDRKETPFSHRRLSNCFRLTRSCLS